MSIDLSELLEQAFFVDEPQNGSVAIERALETFEEQKHVGSRLFEVVAPADPDDEWLRERLVHPLIYFCESEGAAVPDCSGVVVALYVGSHLYAISADRVIRWASSRLGTSIDQLRTQYGTHERDTAQRV